jgi:hypothetical protein
MLIKRKEEKFGIRFSVTDSHFPSELFNFVEDTGYKNTTTTILTPC